MSISDEDKILWDQYKEAWFEFHKIRGGLKREAEDLNQLLHFAINERENIGPILELMASMNPEQLKSYTRILLDYATDSNSGWGFLAEGLLWSLPRQWLLENIEKEGNILLNELGDEEQYYQLIQLYEKLDHAMAVRLAKSALKNTDNDIKQIGKEFLDQDRN